MKTRALAVVVVTMSLSCAASPIDWDRDDCEGCNVSYDCVAFVDECLVCVCNDGDCGIYDLRKPYSRPTDPASGLPLGRECGRQE